MGSIEKTEWHASDEGLIAYDTVRVISILKYRTCSRFGKLRIIHIILHRLRLDRLLPVLGHGGTVCPSGATRLAPVFFKVP
jgi:hypothetical protein